MRKDKLLTIAVIGLLLLNAGTLFTLWTQNRMVTGYPPPRPDAFIIEKLQLDAGQQAEFENMKHEHHEQVMEIDHRLRRLHHDFFALLQTGTPDRAAADSLSGEIARIQQQKDLVTFEHFRKLRAICNPEQQHLFDTFIDEISKRLDRKPPRE